MADTVNLILDQGSTFTYTFELGGSLDLSGMTPYASMKPEYDSNTSVPFTAVLIGANLKISMTSTTTSNTSLVWPGVWVYDAIVVDSTNTVDRVVQGHITITPQVTPHP